MSGVGRPRCAPGAYSSKRGYAIGTARRRCRAGWQECHDLEQEMDYSAARAIMTFYVTRPPVNIGEKFILLHIKFNLCVTLIYVIEFNGFY